MSVVYFVLEWLAVTSTASLCLMAMASAIVLIKVSIRRG